MAYVDKINAGGELREIHDTAGRQMIAPIELTSTATAAHAKGEYFIYNDTLYEATSAIAVGGTITPNTNCTAVRGGVSNEFGGKISQLKSAIETLERWAWPGDNNLTLLNQLVAEGRGPIAAPVGTVIETGKTENNVRTPIVMNVLDHDYHTPVNSAIKHTCTIGMRDCYENRQFDAPEALIKVVDGLAAGSHFYITLNHGAYNGSTSQDGVYGGTLGENQAIPAGGYLRHTTMGGYQSSSYTQAQITGGKWRAYGTDFAQIGADIATDTGDTTGTNFGTATAATANGNSEHVNFTTRNAYGDNRLSKSAWLQYANAQGTGWWQQKTEFDFPPASVATLNGLLTGMDADMLASMVKVKIRVALPTCDGGGYEDVETTVFPLSMTEVNLGANNNQYETSWGLDNTLKTGPVAFYKNAANANRIKTLSGTARHWWLRGPYPSHAYNVRYVNTSGALSHNIANNANGLVAAWAIGNPGIQPA